MLNTITFSNFEQIFNKLNINDFIDDDFKNQLFDFFLKRRWKMDFKNLKD